MSPSLFILGSEVLSRLLSNLFDNLTFFPYFVKHKVPKVNHLAYADDIVIFCGGKNKSIKLIMN